MTNIVYAEDANYWQTSRSAPGVWLERAAKEVEKVGGQVLVQAEGTDPETGKSAYALTFRIGHESFKIVWPVLPSKGGNERAAKVQAATMLFHDVKARCISSYVLGARTAFFAYYMLPDGRTAAEAGSDEVLALFDSVRSGTRQLPPGG